MNLRMLHLKFSETSIWKRSDTYAEHAKMVEDSHHQFHPAVLKLAAYRPCYEPKPSVLCNKAEIDIVMLCRHDFKSCGESGNSFTSLTCCRMRLASVIEISLRASNGVYGLGLQRRLHWSDLTSGNSYCISKL